MPYTIRKLPNRDMYRVSNSESGDVKCKECTLDHAKKQVRLLNYIEHSPTPVVLRNTKTKSKK